MPDGMPDVPEEMLESIGNAVEGVVTPTAAETTNQETPEATASPEGTKQEEAATDAPDSFTKLDPNALPQEVQPYYKSLLSDYTRKTQEAAPYRKLGEELGFSSADDLRQAAELYAYLQNEDNARTFAAQLAQAYGITGQAPAPATEAVQPQAGEEFSNLDDPAVAQLRSELASIKETIAQRDAAQQQEALQWALLGEMNRQEALVKESHPEWEAEGEEWTAVWNLAPTFNGDVVRAAQVVEAAQNAALTRMLNGKAQAATTEGLSAPAPPRLGEAVSDADYSDLELKAQTAQAMEFLRGVVNQSE